MCGVVFTHLAQHASLQSLESISDGASAFGPSPPFTLPPPPPVVNVVAGGQLNG